MSDISLTASMRSNLTSLQNTQDLFDQTQNRLSTGKKVNSALDNPTSYFTAQSLNNRASDLNGLMDSMGQAVQTLNAADKGIESLTSLVEQAESLANQALESPNVFATIKGSATGLTGGSLVTALTGVTAGTDTLAISVEGTASTIAVSAGLTLTQLATDIAAVTGLTASFADGKITISSENAQTDFKINTGDVATGLGIVGSFASIDNRTPLSEQFDDLRTQIDQLVSDTGYKGINLLNGDDLTVFFNENRTSKLDITGVTLDSAGLGVSASAGAWASDTDVNAAISNVRAAKSTLRSQAQTFGLNLSVVQTREDFTEGMVETLTAGADKLVLADMNEESANMLALQTRQQLGTNSLSLASQSAQSVLSLF